MPGRSEWSGECSVEFGNRVLRILKEMYGERDLSAPAQGTDPRSNLPAADRVGSMLGAVENEYMNLPRPEPEQDLINNRRLGDLREIPEKVAGSGKESKI